MAPSRSPEEPMRGRSTRFRVLTAFTVMMVAAAVRPAAGKLCPHGRFALTPRGGPADAMVLRLDGGATLEGHCATASLRPRSFPYGVQLRMRARWHAPCGLTHLVAMRARFDPPCDTLVGVLRARGGAKTRFTATRIPECGNGYVEAGETCDDGNAVGGDCCAADCQAEPGCFIQCERTADCNPVAQCVRQPGQCGGFGACWPVSHAYAPPYDPCTDGPVCGCDARTYVSSCDAWAVGVNVRRPGAC